MAQFVELEKCFINLANVKWVSKFADRVEVYFSSDPTDPRETITIEGKDAQRLVTIIRSFKVIS